MYPLISVLVMALVTYIPRVFPIAFIHRKINSEFIKSFLYYVPYAVLASITFPAIVYSCGNINIAFIATGVSVVLSLLRVKMIYVVFIAIALVYGLLIIL